MDKKDIYEHLAKIYLDASTKKTKERKKYPFFKNLFFFSLAIIFALTVLSLSNFRRNKSLDTELSLVLQPDTVKINFHFDLAKKEIYSLNLNRLDLTRFKALGFSLKKANARDTLSLRVEFNNTFKERAEIYVKDVAQHWQDYKINFSEFKNISDWSEMQLLSFIVEEWNTKEKHGVVYLDNVRFLR